MLADGRDCVAFNVVLLIVHLTLVEHVYVNIEIFEKKIGQHPII